MKRIMSALLLMLSFTFITGTVQQCFLDDLGQWMGVQEEDPTEDLDEMLEFAALLATYNAANFYCDENITIYSCDDSKPQTAVCVQYYNNGYWTQSNITMECAGGISPTPTSTPCAGRSNYEGGLLAICDCTKTATACKKTFFSKQVDSFTILPAQIDSMKLGCEMAGMCTWYQF